MSVIDFRQRKPCCKGLSPGNFHGQRHPLSGAHFYEDNAISDAVLLQAHHYEYIPEVMYFYYQHEASTVHTISRERCEDRMAAGRGILENAKKFGYLETYRPEICFEYTMLFYVNTLFSYMVGEVINRFLLSGRWETN